LIILPKREKTDRGKEVKHKEQLFSVVIKLFGFIYNRVKHAESLQVIFSNGAIFIVIVNDFNGLGWF